MTNPKTRKSGKTRRIVPIVQVPAATPAVIQPPSAQYTHQYPSTSSSSSVTESGFAITLPIQAPMYPVNGSFNHPDRPNTPIVPAPSRPVPQWSTHGLPIRVNSNEEPFPHIFPFHPQPSQAGQTSVPPISNTLRKRNRTDSFPTASGELKKPRHSPPTFGARSTTASDAGTPITEEDSESTVCASTPRTPVGDDEEKPLALKEPSIPPSTPAESPQQDGDDDATEDQSVGSSATATEPLLVGLSTQDEVFASAKANENQGESANGVTNSEPTLSTAEQTPGVVPDGGVGNDEQQSSAAVHAPVPNTQLFASCFSALRTAADKGHALVIHTLRAVAKDMQLGDPAEDAAIPCEAFIRLAQLLTMPSAPRVHGSLSDADDPPLLGAPFAGSSDQGANTGVTSLPHAGAEAPPHTMICAQVATLVSPPIPGATQPPQSTTEGPEVCRPLSPQGEIEEIKKTLLDASRERLEEDREKGRTILYKGYDGKDWGKMRMIKDLYEIIDPKPEPKKKEEFVHFAFDHMEGKVRPHSSEEIDKKWGSAIQPTQEAQGLPSLPSQTSPPTQVPAAPLEHVIQGGGARSASTSIPKAMTTNPRPKTRKNRPVKSKARKSTTIVQAAMQPSSSTNQDAGPSTSTPTSAPSLAPDVNYHYPPGQIHLYTQGEDTLQGVAPHAEDQGLVIPNIWQFTDLTAASAIPSETGEDFFDTIEDIDLYSLMPDDADYHCLQPQPQSLSPQDNHPALSYEEQDHLIYGASQLFSTNGGRFEYALRFADGGYPQSLNHTSNLN